MSGIWFDKNEQMAIKSGGAVNVKLLVMRLPNKIYDQKHVLNYIFQSQLTKLTSTNKLSDILDPRSQRAGSYKFGAVIVNV